MKPALPRAVRAEEVQRPHMVSRETPFAYEVPPHPASNSCWS